jgi:hypothetical protein
MDNTIKEIIIYSSSIYLALMAYSFCKVVYYKVSHSMKISRFKFFWLGYSYVRWDKREEFFPHAGKRITKKMF